MTLTSDDVLRYLEDHGISARTYDHPPVHTVAESRAQRGAIPGAHTKNLFLRDGKKTYFLVTLDESTAVDLKALRVQIGARGGLSFASPEALFAHLGVRPGAVSSLALANDTAGAVQVIIEADLMTADCVGCHPLSNDRTTVLTPDQLRVFFAATGHSVRYITLQTPASAAD